VSDSALDYERTDDGVGCEYCGALFAAPELLALHRGHEHGERLDESEREAFEAAYEAEQADIRRFRLKALGALVLLYFGFLMVYAVV
jgi:hypothetical protein